MCTAHYQDKSGTKDLRESLKDEGDVFPVLKAVNHYCLLSFVIVISQFMVSA